MSEVRDQHAARQTQEDKKPGIGPRTRLHWLLLSKPLNRQLFWTIAQRIASPTVGVPPLGGSVRGRLKPEFQLSTRKTASRRTANQRERFALAWTKGKVERNSFRSGGNGMNSVLRQPHERHATANRSNWC